MPLSFLSFFFLKKENVSAQVGPELLGSGDPLALPLESLGILAM